jgi:hypothetical protein
MDTQGALDPAKLDYIYRAFEVTGESAKAAVTVVYDGESEDEHNVVTFSLTEHEENWVITEFDDFYFSEH